MLRFVELILTGEQLQPPTALHLTGCRNTLVYFLWKSTRRIQLKTKALGKCSPWLVWQQSTREALRGTIQWYQEVSHVPFLILFSFFCAPCWNRQPTFPSSTPKFNRFTGLIHWWQPPQDNKCLCLDWFPVWSLTLLSMLLLHLFLLSFNKISHKSVCMRS